MKINGNCKGVRCLTNGKFYHGMKYAAMEAGVTCSSMSYAIKNKTPCKGNKYAWESEMEANVMAMGLQLSEKETEMEMLRAKANAYDALMLEQKAKEEAERKAKEEHAKAIAKLEEKLDKYEAEIARREEKLNDLKCKWTEVLKELEALREMEV